MDDKYRCSDFFVATIILKDLNRTSLYILAKDFLQYVQFVS